MKNGWTYKKLGEVFEVTDFVANGSFATLRKNVTYYNEPNFAVLVRLADFSSGFDKSKFVYVDEQSYKFLSKSYLLGGEIIMSNVGSIGKCFICPKLAEKMTLGPNSLLLKTPNNNFYLYYLKSESFQNQLISITNTTTLSKFNKTQLKTLEIPVPPLSEQQRIVERLDAAFAQIDELKAKAEKQLNEARQLFQAELTESMRPKEGWEEKKLGEFAYMKAGDSVKANDIYSEYHEGLFPCYGGNGFRGYVKEANQKGDYCMIGRQGALCGCINRANGIFRTTEHAVIVKPYNEIPTSLVYYLLVSLDLNKYATGAAQPGLSVKNIAENVRINIPPSTAQQRIVAHLDALSENVRKYEEIQRKTIAECDALKQAILREVFEG